MKNINDLLAEVSTKSHFSDAQLSHFNKLQSKWRSSEANKTHFANLGRAKQKYTQEQIDTIRINFWEKDWKVQDCMDFLGTKNGAAVKSYLKNESYYDPNFKWDVSLYGEVRKKRLVSRKVRAFILTEEYLDVLNGMDCKTFCKKYGKTKVIWANRRDVLRKKGYMSLSK